MCSLFWISIVRFFSLGVREEKQRQNHTLSMPASPKKRGRPAGMTGAKPPLVTKQPANTLCLGVAALSVLPRALPCEALPDESERA